MDLSKINNRATRVAGVALKQAIISNTSLVDMMALMYISGLNDGIDAANELEEGTPPLDRFAKNFQL